MYKTCNGCRAISQTGTTFTCELGYPLESKSFQGVPVSAIPALKCPKPRTYDRFMGLKLVGNRGKY